MSLSHADDKMYKVYAVAVFESEKCEKYIQALFDDYRYNNKFFMIPLHYIKRVVDFVTGFFNQTNDLLNQIMESLNNTPSNVLALKTDT